MQLAAGPPGFQPSLGTHGWQEAAFHAGLLAVKMTPLPWMHLRPPSSPVTSRHPALKTQTPPWLPPLRPPQPRQQTIKQLEGLLVKAVKAGAACTAQARSAAHQELDQLELELPAARAALGTVA